MKSQKGQSLVETALVIPILLLLVFGITDFGRIFFTYLTLNHAGREAARVASIDPVYSDIKNKIEKATESIDKNKTKVIFVLESPPGTVITSSSPKPKSGNDITITLKYPVDFLTPIIGNLVGELKLENKTVMRIE